jgi:molybdenum cofactor biosynthesis enzyme MoaA
MIDFDGTDYTVPPTKPDENQDGSVGEHANRSLLQFRNIRPSHAHVAATDVMPGRRDLRISLTSACNLKCSYCHNEGRKAPWLHKTKTSALFSNIDELLSVATRYGVQSVKFSGGDPGVYSDVVTLMAAIAAWRERYPNIAKWGIATNGVPFLDPKKFHALVESRLDNLSIGIDSVEPGERSKPASPVGIPGTALIDKFVRPLMKEWEGRSIKLDTVFTGDESRTRNVIRTARDLGVKVSVVEVNDVKGAPHTAREKSTVREKFLGLIDETADKYGLKVRYHAPLNEYYLYNDQGDAPVKFYQDHCQDLDCGNCRKIHLRVSPIAQGLGAIPCFLRAQSRTIPLTVDGALSAARFEDAIRHNGGGPHWFKDTAYDSVKRQAGLALGP